MRLGVDHHDRARGGLDVEHVVDRLRRLAAQGADVVDGEVGADAQHPGTELEVPLAADALRGAEEGLLGELLGDGLVPAQTGQAAHHQGAVATVELLEGADDALAEGVDQSLVIELGECGGDHFGAFPSLGGYRKKSCGPPREGPDASR